MCSKGFGLIATQTYKIRNWSKYNKSLVKRGSLTLWFDEESIRQWHTSHRTGKGGRPTNYSDTAILCLLTIKAVFNLPLRATQGFVTSLIDLLMLPRDVTYYTTFAADKKHLTLR